MELSWIWRLVYLLLLIISRSCRTQREHPWLGFSEEGELPASESRKVQTFVRGLLASHREYKKSFYDRLRYDVVSVPATLNTLRKTYLTSSEIGQMWTSNVIVLVSNNWLSTTSLTRNENVFMVNEQETKECLYFPIFCPFSYYLCFVTDSNAYIFI